MKTNELVNAFMCQAELKGLSLANFNIFMYDGMIEVQLTEESDFGCWVSDKSCADYNCEYSVWSDNLQSYLDICKFLNKVVVWYEEFKKEFNL